jgi:site-specific recombinase XerD
MGYEKVNIELPESAKEFLNYCKIIKGLAQGSCDGYDCDLRLFFNFLKVHKKKNKITNAVLRNIKLTDLHAFMYYLESECGNSAQARSRKVSTLKGYFEYLEDVAEIITSNPTRKLPKPKVPKTQPKYLTLEECEELLNSLNKDYKHYERDYCILTLFLNCGMRVSELANMKFDDIKGDMLIIKGKGDKERTVYLNKACLKAIQQYLIFRDDYKISDGRMFNIKKQAIEVFVKKYIVKAGIKNADEYSVHKLRHTSATLMHKYGKVSLRNLQSILGHSSPATTAIYTHVDDESLRDAVKSNPLNNLK